MSDMYVIAGQHSFSQTTGDEEISPVAEFTPHRAYNNNTRANDIALIKVGREFPLGPNIKPACLPRREDFAYQKGVVSGWGDQSFGKNLRGVCVCVCGGGVTWNKAPVSVHTIDIPDKYIRLVYNLNRQIFCSGV